MLDLKEVGYGRMRVSNYKKDGTVFEVTISVFPVFDSTAPNNNNNTNNSNKGMMMKDGGDSAVLTHLASILTDVKVYPPGYGRGGSSSDETSSFDGTSTNASNYPSNSISQNDTNMESTNSGVKEKELMMNTTSEEANQTSSGSNQFSSFRPSLFERSEQQRTSQSGSSNQGTTSSSLTSDKNHMNSAEVGSNNNNQHQQQQQGAPHEAQQHQQFMQHHHNLQQQHQQQNQQQPHHFNYHPQPPQFMNNYYQRQDNSTNNNHYQHDRHNNIEVPREEEDEGEEDGQEESYEETSSSRDSDSPNYDRREKAKKFDAKCVISEEVNLVFLFFFSELVSLISFIPELLPLRSHPPVIQFTSTNVELHECDGINRSSGSSDSRQHRLESINWI
jgi:hypothetical protein